MKRLGMRDAWRTLKQIIKGYLHLDIVRNCNHIDSPKRCLLIYITHPFSADYPGFKHQNVWQCVELTRILGEFHYQVDVIDYRNQYARPVGKYDLVMGLIPRGIDVYSCHLKKNAKKIAYLTSSNLQVTNENEKKRLEDLYQRRGVRLEARRQAGQIEKKIEEFDGALFFGNDYNLKSYACFKMPPVYYLANNGYDYSFEINFTKDPSKFLFFGSVGQVHKGLDLLLEVFSEIGEPYELFVCGQVDEEQDFAKEYEKELYQTHNIHTVGFIEVGSRQFEELVNKCAYLLLPSCAEGQAGSVTTVMSAGVVPICSKECGFDDDGVILLPDCSKETIRTYVLQYAEKDRKWVEKRSKEAYTFCTEHYSQISFSDSVRRGLFEILGEAADA